MRGRRQKREEEDDLFPNNMTQLFGRSFPHRYLQQNLQLISYFSSALSVILLSKGYKHLTCARIIDMLALFVKKQELFN